MKAIKPAKLPPLSKRTTRVVLLANTYLDVATSQHDHLESHGKPGSRQHVRNALWESGSYHELETLLDALRAVPRLHPLYCAFWKGYVARKHPHPDWTPSAKLNADWALVWVTKRMPASIYVPPDVTENAGYGAGEARVYSRPGRRAA